VIDMFDTDDEIRSLYRRLEPTVDDEELYASLRQEVAKRKHAITPRRTSGLRVVLYAALAVVIVAAIAVGTLEAVKYLGKDQPILVITDETTVTTGATTTTTQATTTTAPTDTGAAMVGGNAARTGVYPSGGPTERPDLLWKFKTGDWEGTSPVVADGVVYVSGGYPTDDQNDEYAYLYALDARSGEEKWRLPWSTDWSHPSCPAVSEGVVYIAGRSEDIDDTGSNGEYLYALDAETGQERWKFRTPFGVTPSPAVSDGLVYFGTDGGYLYALDAASGQLKWKFLPMGRGGDPAAVSSSPAVSDGVVYFGTDDGSLYALDAQTGQEKWTLADYALSPRGSPAVSEGVVYFVFGPYLRALDAQTGEEKWTYMAGGEIRSSLAVSGGVVYIFYEAYRWGPEGDVPNALFVALDATTGKELWQFATVNNVCYMPWSGSPGISGEVVYFGTKTSCDGQGRLHALNALTGEELWTWVTPGSEYFYSHVVTSSPAISDGVVYFSGNDGYLYALK